MNESIGQVVWQERPSGFVFVARKGKRIFLESEILTIRDELKAQRTKPVTPWEKRNAERF